MTTATATEKKRDVKTLAGKYLTFQLKNETYGVEILAVREIIRMMDITHVPQLPEYVKGVINLRGSVIPVIDLRLKFGLEEIEKTDESCVIVVQVNSINMGVIVDRVSEVLDVTREHIDETPSFGGGVDTRFILGVYKTDKHVAILLDIDQSLNSDGELDNLDLPTE